MMRLALKHVAVALLFAGILLRALTPVGYMPGSSGDGTLFLLCPDQLPPGVTLAGSDSAHNHHMHHGAGEDSPTDSDSDLCPMGHLLFSAVAADQGDDNSILIPASDEYFSFPTENARFTPVLSYRSRAPPA